MFHTASLLALSSDSPFQKLLHTGPPRSETADGAADSVLEDGLWAGDMFSSSLVRRATQGPKRPLGTSLSDGERCR